MKTRQPQKLTISRFWEKYPWPYRIKQAVDGLIEFIFLLFSIRRKVRENDKECTAHPAAGHNLKLALSITIGLHVIHVARLIYRIITSYVKDRTIVGGIIKCLLMDCYCTCASFVYIFV